MDFSVYLFNLILQSAIRINIKSNHECKKENFWISADWMGCLLFMPVHRRASDRAGRFDKVSQTETG